MEKLAGSRYMIGLTNEGHSLSEAAFATAEVWIQIFLDAFVKHDEEQLELLNTMESVEGGVENFVEIRDHYPALSVTTQNSPYHFALHANYPNPFNPVTTIRYDLTEVSHVTLSIYDVAGRRVRTL